MMRPLCCQPFKAGLTFFFLVLALVVILTSSPAMAQAVTNFGSNSGVTCPGGNIICNGSINFLTTELFFEPATPSQGLKDTLVTWNEVEYLLDNPYPTTSTAQTVVGAGATVTGAPVCNDGSGPQPLN